MSWSEGQRGGLVFVSFGHSLQSFAAQLRRMVGLEDGITDAYFNSLAQSQARIFGVHLKMGV